MPRLVRLTEVELHTVCMRLVQLLHQIQSALAQRLTNRIEEYKYEIR